jgi:membrane fusion protein (multidrug efflux system)
VDFQLPQQKLSQITLSQSVLLTTDSYPGHSFTGKVTAINPKVDTGTRNFLIEALIDNPGHKLLPGMYASVTVRSGKEQSYLTLPKTCVTYNPYGETVYLIEEKGNTKDGKTALFAKQTFITVGPSRGDQVAILKGVKAGDLVVTSGQLKLKNGSPVIVNNQVQPLNDAAPAPVDQ